MDIANLINSTLPESYNSTFTTTFVLRCSVVLAVVILGYVTFIKSGTYNGKKGSQTVPEKRKIKVFDVSEEYKEPEVPSVDADFNWETAEPRKYRPFKNGEYKLTMAIKAMDPVDWLLVENSYMDRINLRRRVTTGKEELPHTVLHHESAYDAIVELYNKVMSYMTRRYPMYFKVVTKDGEEVVENLIANLHVPLHPEGLDATTLIQKLAVIMEEDFLILIPNKENYDPKDEEVQYYLRAGCFAFPAGFDPAEKLNNTLADIHIPVPMYREKLQLSMDRFFKRVKAGQWVERLNWSVQKTKNLYTPSGLHGHSGVTEFKKIDPSTMDFNNVFVRTERQMLTRLPKTKAVLFTVRTYLTPLPKIKAEGLGEELAGAISGLPDPIQIYKRAKEWGPPVQAFLRGETTGSTPIKEY